MPVDLERLKQQVHRLSAEERAELAYYLISTLEPQEEGVDEAWENEIARRVTEIRAGTAIGRPAEEVFARLRTLHL
jgi:putative addiction module component (TIGR02574 family)